MNWWRRLVRDSQMEQQLDRELRFHLEQHEADLLARGVDPAEARRQARLSIGGPAQVKEECRDARGTQALVSMAQDFRYAARRLRREPGFAAVTVAALALGMGATTAIFSAVKPILLDPLPYPHAGRILSIWDFGRGGARAQVTFGTYVEVGRRSRQFDVLAVFKPWQPTLVGTEAERLEGQNVTADYFRVLGVAPAIGRDFQAADDQPNAPRVVILSDGMSRRRFPGDGTIIGREITLDDERYTVIGVMPRTFENVSSPAAEVWSPLRYNSALPGAGKEWGHHLRMLGRLRPAASPASARADLNGIARHPIGQVSRPPWASLAQGLIVNPLQDDVTRGVRPALLAVLGAVVLLLFIACVNVTNLLLARASQRRPEFAMRAALGAGRLRMMRQLLTESLLLAIGGGAMGMAVAAFGVRALVALSRQGLPRVDAIRLDGAILAFSMGITTLIGLAVGLIPALDSARSDPQSALQAASQRTSGRRQWTRRALVVSEVAVALVLLVGAGLLLRSLRELFAIAPGFDGSQVLTMQVETYGRRFDDPATHHYFDQVLEEVRRVPGVAAAAFSSQLPLSGDIDEYGVRFEGDDSNTGYESYRYAVTPGYLEAMKIPLLSGRLFGAGDSAEAPAAAIVSESLARRKFQGQNPLGHRLQVGGMRNTPWATVVGVVGDVKQVSLALTQASAVYVIADQYPADAAMSLVVRARGDAAAMAPAVRNAIWSVDRNEPILRVATMDTLLTASGAERRFVFVLFEAFALAALALAAIGIYGVLAGSVNERTREIGVRVALGASRADILRLVFRQGMTLTVLGAAIGLAGAAGAGRVLVTLLFRVSWLDPLTYAGVIVLLSGVSALACWVPAWRAARVDPAVALRAE